MTTSKLVGRKLSTNKSSSRQGNTPKQFIIHHTAGGGNALALRMLSGTLGPNDKKVSAHYILLTTGELVGSVDEERRAWTTGWNADKTAITVETVNVSGAPHWGVTDRQIAMLGRLAADLSIRYNWGPLTRQNVRGHKEFAATACPGPSIWPRMDEIVAHANRVRARWLNADTSNPTPTPPVGSLADLDLLIQKIIRGELGNGEERVNRLKTLGFNDQQIKAIATEVTRRYNEIRAEQAAKPPTSAELIEIHRMITSIIRGDWGNGKERIERLAAAGFTQDQIDALQAAVTERMKG